MHLSVNVCSINHLCQIYTSNIREKTRAHPNVTSQTQHIHEQTMLKQIKVEVKFYNQNVVYCFANT